MVVARGGSAECRTATPPPPGSAYGVCCPALVPAGVVEQVVVLPDGSRRVVPHTPPSPAGVVPYTRPAPAGVPDAGAAAEAEPAPGVPAAQPPGGRTVRAALGRVAGARAGDKGGNANVGLWARHTEALGWLRTALTVELFRTRLPEAAGTQARRA